MPTPTLSAPETGSKSERWKTKPALSGATTHEVDHQKSQLSTNALPARTSCGASLAKVGLEERLVREEYKKLLKDIKPEAFDDLAAKYRNLEIELVKLEKGGKRESSNFLTSLVRNAVHWYQCRSLNRELKSIRAQEEKLIGQVHKRAEHENISRLQVIEGTPALLRRASIPPSKQNKVPSFEDLARELASVGDKVLNRAQVVVNVGANDVTMIRSNGRGQTESMMFRTRDDGRVTCYIKHAGENAEWTRMATVWNDNAFDVGIEFLNKKALPKIRKAPSEKISPEGRIIAKLECNNRWIPPGA